MTSVEKTRADVDCYDAILGNLQLQKAQLSAMIDILEKLKARGLLNPRFDLWCTGKTVHEAAVMLLERSGSPMKTRQLVEAICDGGKSITYSSLYIAARSPGSRLERVGPGLWRLKVAG